MAEQRYQAILAVISDGRTVKEVAADWSVSRQTLHTWLARYEAGGLEGLADRSHRPASCPHQMPGWCWRWAGSIRRGGRAGSGWSGPAARRGPRPVSPVVPTPRGLSLGELE